MFTRQSYIILVSTVTLAVAAKVQSARVATLWQAALYLSKSGYLPISLHNSESSGLLDYKSLHKAMQDFQYFAGLNATGELDKETIELMSLPRCGVRDKLDYGNHNRSKRYALQGSRWNKKNLSYRIYNYPKNLVEVDVDYEIARAFSLWSAHTDLSFTPKQVGQVDIGIRFVKGDHGDSVPFDGRGGTLAHAFYPMFGGETHFDDDELWTIGIPSGTNLFQVAAHEFGHSLGLEHSKVFSALMTPFYRQYIADLKLDTDDILGIQALYGKKSSGNTPKPTVVPTRTPTDDELCMDPKIDTIFNSPEGRTYAFKDNKYYMISETVVTHGYPKLISDGWPGLPNNIDAAFTYKARKTFFFKGSEYWRYTGSRLDANYPKRISDGFIGIPNNLDAAMASGSIIFFFKGAKYWRFDTTTKRSYSKSISVWKGLPKNVDAAFQYTSGLVFFFKGHKYYRFNKSNAIVESSAPSAYFWFGCKNTPSAGFHSYQVEDEFNIGRSVMSNGATQR